MFYNFKFKYQHFFIICLYHQTQLSMSSFAFRAHRHAQLGQIPVEAGKLRTNQTWKIFFNFFQLVKITLHFWNHQSIKPASPTQKYIWGVPRFIFRIRVFIFL